MSTTPQLELTGSRQLPNWLAEQRVSLAFTTYQAGKLFFIGVQPDRSLSIFERTFNRCMGLCSAGNTLWMNSLVQLWRFEPHSPRWYRDKLWLLDSGSGWFGWVDPARGVFERVCFCPGFARGLSFVGDFAVVGLSKPRDNKTFADLALADELAKRDADPRCGLHVIDLRTGDAVHWLRIEGVVAELYDVVPLPGIRRPMALGFVTDEIRRMLTVES